MGSPATSPPLCPRWAVGGKAHASRSSHVRLSASTAVARGSGTGDTNRQLIVETRGKQVYLGPVPPAAYRLEDLWKERSLCLDGLA